MPKLTQRFVNEASPKPGKNQTLFWDSELKGFGLRLTQGGMRRWVFQYENPKIRRRYRRVTLGDAVKLTAHQARSLAIQMAAKVEMGEDPGAERLEARNALTVTELAERYLEEHARPKKKPSSVALDERLFRKCILPHLGQLKVPELSSSDVRKMHHALRKTPVQANRALLVLSKALNLAEAWGLRPQNSNPCRSIEKYREQRRQRFLSSTELARLGEELSHSENREHPTAILALRLLLLTGARSGEILKLRWSEVDFERRCLRLEDSKTGAKTIPLGAPALEVLSQALRIEGNPYVCTGHRAGQHFVGLAHIWERIRKRADLDDVRIHDLRHSFASVGASSGLGLPILGALLGHSQPQTTNRYAHLAADPVHEAAERISETVAASLEGAKASVHPFRKKDSGT